MAENLAHGRGLVGNFPGPETMYAPLLSVLTAGLSVLTRNSELAAHLICLVFGVALIIPVFFIALRMYDIRVAYLSAALVAFHPLLIALSGSIFNENVYITLLLASVYFGMRSLESRRNRDYVLLGLCLSLAYLSRPEAFAYLWFFVLAALDQRRSCSHCPYAGPPWDLPSSSGPSFSWLRRTSDFFTYTREVCGGKGNGTSITPLLIAAVGYEFY